MTKLVRDNADINIVHMQDLIDKSDHTVHRLGMHSFGFMYIFSRVCIDHFNILFFEDLGRGTMGGETKFEV